jgi:hypothetical protein
MIHVAGPFIYPVNPNYWDYGILGSQGVRPISRNCVRLLLSGMGLPVRHGRRGRCCAWRRRSIRDVHGKCALCLRGSLRACLRSACVRVAFAPRRARRARQGTACNAHAACRQRFREHEDRIDMLRCTMHCRIRSGECLQHVARSLRCSAVSPLSPPGALQAPRYNSNSIYQCCI